MSNDKDKKSKDSKESSESRKDAGSSHRSKDKDVANKPKYRRGRDKERRMRDSTTDSSSDESTPEEKSKHVSESAEKKNVDKYGDKSRPKGKYSQQKSKSTDKKFSSHGRRDSSSSSSSSGSDSSPVRKSKNLSSKRRDANPKRKDDSRDVKLHRRGDSSKYKQVDKRKKRGRSKERRLRDSSLSSSSSSSTSGSSPSPKLRDDGLKSRKGGDRSTSSKSNTRLEVLRSPDKQRIRKRTRDSSISSSSSGEHDKVQSKGSRYSSSTRDNAKKHVAPEKSRVTVVKRRSRTPEQRYKDKKGEVESPKDISTEDSKETPKKISDPSKESPENISEPTKELPKIVSETSEELSKLDAVPPSKEEPKDVYEPSKQKEVHKEILQKDVDIIQQKGRSVESEKDQTSKNSSSSQHNVSQDKNIPLNTTDGYLVSKDFGSNEDSIKQSKLGSDSKTFMIAVQDSHEELVTERVSTTEEVDSENQILAPDNRAKETRSSFAKHINVEVSSIDLTTICLPDSYEKVGIKPVSTAEKAISQNQILTEKRATEAQDTVAKPSNVEGSSTDVLTITVPDSYEEIDIEPLGTGEEANFQNEKLALQTNENISTKNKLESQANIVDQSLLGSPKNLQEQKNKAEKSAKKDDIDVLELAVESQYQDEENLHYEKLVKRTKHSSGDSTSDTSSSIVDDIKKRDPIKADTVRGRESRQKSINRRKAKRDSSSSSSSSSSSTKSRSDSASSSGSSSSSSSSSNTDSKSSGGRSSSSSSSSSVPKRHKRPMKTKEPSRKRSRSPVVKRRKRSASPRPKKIHVGRLSRNVNKDHLYEIFGLFGTVKNVDLPVDRIHGNLSKGFAYIEFETAEQADKALVHMNGGVIDSQKISVSPVLPYKPRPLPPRRMSPVRRPFMRWRRTPPYRSRGGGLRRRMRSPFRRRTQRRPRSRTRSRSPIYRRRMRRGSLSSSR